MHFEKIFLKFFYQDKNFILVYKTNEILLDFVFKIADDELGYYCELET